MHFRRFSGFLSTRVVMLAAAVGIACPCARAYLPEQSAPAPSPLPGIASTRFVGTLDEAMPAGTNTVWCASLPAAWKALQDDVTKGPVRMQGSPPLAEALNKTADPRKEMPPDIVYAAAGRTKAGWFRAGIVERINSDMAKKFPSKAPVSFPGLADDGVVAYAYIEANLKFPIPYFQNRTPLVFTDSRGGRTGVRSFGLRPEDKDAYHKLRAQTRVLFATGDTSSPDFEFAVDLWGDSPSSQLVLARIRPESSLEAAVKRVDNECKSYASASREISFDDVLLVPEMSWKLTHRFAELEGKPFENPSVKGMAVDVIQQDIDFRLDRSGVELKSEMTMYPLLAGTEGVPPRPVHYVIDRPFLLYMKKRGATSPYLAMWIDNAGLLTAW